LLHHDTVIAVKNTFDLCGFDAEGRRPTDEYADQKTAQPMLKVMILEQIS
jgi:hypothetical protein